MFEEKQLVKIYLSRVITPEDGYVRIGFLHDLSKIGISIQTANGLEFYPLSNVLMITDKAELEQKDYAMLSEEEYDAMDKKED